VSDTATTTTSSDANSTGDAGAGSAGDGAVGGTQSTADTFAAEREQYEARVRSFQSEKDKLAARASELEAQLAAVTSGTGNGDDGGSAANVVDPEVLLSRFEERLELRDALKEAQVSLQGEFPLADPALFNRAKEFKSVDAFKSAIESSHRANDTIVSAEMAKREAAIREDVNKRYGINLVPATPNGGEVPSGDPSIETIAAMSFAEQREFEAANPGVIERVLRSAT
jgi:hypothetical protein